MEHEIAYSHYQSFLDYTRFHDPSVYFKIVSGQVGVEEMKTYVLAWAKDISMKGK